jgi:protein-tyrosine phosphatase
MHDARFFHFAPADDQERIVFGACRPGYPHPYPTREDVEAWSRFMKSQGIERVVCLLTGDEVFARHAEHFGAEYVLHVPTPDFSLPTRRGLLEAMEFLEEAARHSSPAVVHCGGGIGRSAVVLAAWLVRSRGWSADAAIDAVQSAPVLRDVYEAVGTRVTEKGVRELISSACP